jgi:hypothetical protein
MSAGRGEDELARFVLLNGLAGFNQQKKGAPRRPILFRLSREHGARLRYARGAFAFPRASSGDARYVSSSCNKLCRQD